MSEVAEEVLAEDLENTDATKDLFLTFEIEDEDYAIDVVYIKEIITMCDITRVPLTQDYLKGIINLRGDIVPVINIRTRFMMPEEEFSDLTCIVVLDYGEYIIGLIVDQVKGVLTITEEMISAPPDTKLNHNNQFVESIGKTEEGIKLILDIDKLLF